MILPSSVMAQVIDICSPTGSFPKTVVVDANVLYFVHYVKRLRYHYVHNLATIRGHVDTYVQSARRTVTMLPAVRTADPFSATFQRWRSSTADIGDAALVTEAKWAGVSDVLSDDADFVTFEGIQLYTANRAVVAAASAAGKLTRGSDKRP
jgi:predicted nucleic acid-binding protein